MKRTNEQDLKSAQSTKSGILTVLGIIFVTMLIASQCSDAKAQQPQTRTSSVLTDDIIIVKDLEGVTDAYTLAELHDYGFRKHGKDEYVCYERYRKLLLTRIDKERFLLTTCMGDLSIARYLAAGYLSDMNNVNHK
jgi:hypothetical protein